MAAPRPRSVRAHGARRFTPGGPVGPRPYLAFATLAHCRSWFALRRQRTYSRAGTFILGHEISVDRMSYKDSSAKQTQNRCDRFHHFDAPCFTTGTSVSRSWFRAGFIGSGKWFRRTGRLASCCAARFLKGSWASRVFLSVCELRHITLPRIDLLWRFSLDCDPSPMAGPF